MSKSLISLESITLSKQVTSKILILLKIKELLDQLSQMTIELRYNEEIEYKKVYN